MNTLPMRPTEAVQIGNSCFSFVKRDGRVEYFSNLEPFDFHADDQREAKLLRIAKFRLPDLELERVSCFCTREVGLGDFSG